MSLVTTRESPKQWSNHLNTLYALSGRALSFCSREYFSRTLEKEDFSFLSLVMEFSMLNESSTHPKSGFKLDHGPRNKTLYTA
jgi:hypothetical protein